jgi:hypothetical protein
MVEVAVVRAREGTQAARISIPASVSFRAKVHRFEAVISKSSLLRSYTESDHSMFLVGKGDGQVASTALSEFKKVLICPLLRLEV